MVTVTVTATVTVTVTVLTVTATVTVSATRHAHANRREEVAKFLSDLVCLSSAGTCKFTHACFDPDAEAPTD